MAYANSNTNEINNELILRIDADRRMVALEATWEISALAMLISAALDDSGKGWAINGQTTKAFLHANKVPYETGGGFFSREKNNADIAEDAKKWTVLVECWK